VARAAFLGRSLALLIVLFFVFLLVVLRSSSSRFTHRRRILTRQLEALLRERGGQMDVLGRAAVHDLALLRALLDTVRSLIGIILPVSLMAGLAVVVVGILALRKQGITSEGLEKLLTSTLWKVLLGFFAPAGSLITWYSSLQGKAKDANETFAKLLQSRAIAGHAEKGGES
jgi:hypothetical protein